MLQTTRAFFDLFLYEMGVISLYTEGLIDYNATVVPPVLGPLDITELPQEQPERTRTGTFQLGSTDIRNYKKGNQIGVSQAYSLIYSLNNKFSYYPFILCVDNKDFTRKPVTKPMPQMAHYLSVNYKYREGFEYYITANSFVCPKGTPVTAATRCTANLKALNNVVIDIDLHNYPGSKAQQNELKARFLREVYEGLRKQDLFFPNVENHTPNGVHLWYHIDQASVEMLWLYELVVTNICNFVQTVIEQDSEFSKYIQLDRGASKKAAGVFRAFGLTGPCRVVQSEGYSLHNLWENFRAYQEQLKTKQKAPKKAIKFDKSVLFIGQAGYRMRLIDWYIKRHPETFGNRDNILFIAYNTAFAAYGDREKAEQFTLAMNNQFNTPLSTSEIQDKITQTHKETPYKFKADTFYDYLGISADELTEFRATNTKNGIREQKRGLKADRDKQIVEMREQGYTQEQIAAAVGCSKDTVKRVLKANKNTETPTSEVPVEQGTEQTHSSHDVEREKTGGILKEAYFITSIEKIEPTQFYDASG